MILQVLKSALEERPAPAFLPNDNVRIVKKNIYAVVWQYLWHYKKHYYYTLVDKNGKMLKKRYIADELEKEALSK